MNDSNRQTLLKGLGEGESSSAAATSLGGLWRMVGHVVRVLIMG